MHGRLKIKTTAEQQESKRIEREKKLKLFKAGTERLLEKRKNKEHDEEALSLTKDFLLQNPDLSTLWNFRREILLSMKPEKTEEELQSMGSNELDLTQNCLKTNPKSYAAWHHRFWTLEFMPHPDLTKELKLCNLFLSYDERNFHCWDYRRMICKKACINPEEELNFTTDLIKKNFSNYSAWHYRSTLLPIVHPGSGYTAVNEETLLKEYEIVQNAAFTDPNDQSVWFYHRWLLGRGNKDVEILSIVVLSKLQMVIVFFACPVEVKNDNVQLFVNETEVQVCWKPAYEEMEATTVWYCNLPHDLAVEQQPTEISVQFKNELTTNVLKCFTNGNLSYAWKLKDNSMAFSSDISAATKDVLEKELESCQQLYELEPENKWTLFTTVLLMKAIDSQKYQSEISSHLEQLTSIDSMRKGYYRDLQSKFLIENFIESMPLETTQLHLANKNLTSLYHFDYFILMKEVNLSNNDLSSVKPLQYLLCVCDLILDGNKIKDCRDIRNLPCLEKLSLKTNQIHLICDLNSLTTCKQLKHLFLHGNPITEAPMYETEVKTLLENVTLDTR